MTNQPKLLPTASLSVASDSLTDGERKRYDEVRDAMLATSSTSRP